MRLPVTCRPARGSDTSDVLEITNHIWDGEDYVPHVWREWLTDQYGVLAVAEYQESVIGLGKLTQLTPDDWWMEGLRVHPEYEGRGVASQLHDYMLECWERTGCCAIRLATSSERKSVHHLCERTGFVRVGEAVLFKADALPVGRNNFHRITMDEIPKAFKTIVDSPFLNLNNRLIDLGWQWTSPHITLVEGAVSDGTAYWWLSQGSWERGLIMYWLDDWENSEQRSKPVPMIKLLLCHPDDIVDCLLDFRRLAAQQGYDRVGWMAPLQPELVHILGKAGFQTDWDSSLYIFAKARQ